MGVACLTVSFLLDYSRGEFCFGGMVGIFGARWNVVCMYCMKYCSETPLMSVKGIIRRVHYGLSDTRLMNKINQLF